MLQKNKILEEAREFLVGGVNSPVRALTRPKQLLAIKAEGPYIWDAELGKLVDYVLGYGPLILGHKHPEVVKALKGLIKQGWLFGATTPIEVQLAKKILSHVYPGGKIRFVNSGTEATMLAIRLARAYTNRKYIVKFEGCYHGAHDHVLVSVGSAATHLSIPNSPGIPEEVSRLVLTAPYNNMEIIDKIFDTYGDEIAAVIVEPVLGNYGVIPPVKGFLEHLRKITRLYGSLLIFDEVITGFRLSLGGAQEYYGIKADLVTLGKIIGGGLPIGAVAGPAEIMNLLTPIGKVFNAGTFNGHPLSMTAGLATLKVLEQTGLNKAFEHAKGLEEIINEILSNRNVSFAINRIGAMLQFYIGIEEASDPKQVNLARRDLYEKIHEELVKNGVLIPPSQYEALFTSIVHTHTELEKFHEAFKNSARRIF